MAKDTVGRGRLSALATLRSRIDAIRIAGKPITWPVTGWRGYTLLLIAAILLPQFVGNYGALVPGVPNEALLTSAITVGIYVLLALGLNIVVGYAGLLDLGYVAFFAIGAYTVAIFTNGFLYGSDGKAHTWPILSFWYLLPIAAVIAAFLGVVLGAPTLRLRGDYLAIVTLGFGEIVPIFLNNVPWFDKQAGLPSSGPNDIGSISFTNPLDHIWFYYLALTVIVLIILFVKVLRDSSIGRAWIAIREDETAAAASGVNLVRTKLLAFGLGAFIGGIGGALYGGTIPHVDTSTMTFNVSIIVLMMVVLGGIGSIPGVIVGAVLLEFVDNYLLNQINSAVHTSSLVVGADAPLHFLADFDFNYPKYLIYGVILLIMILLRPQGLIPDVRRRRELKGIGASVEGTSAVGLFEREEAGIAESVEGGGDDSSSYAGSGSDSRGREG